MAEPDTQQTDIPADPSPASDELDTLLAEFDAQTASAGDGHDEPSQDAQSDQHPANGNAVEDITAEDVFEDFRLRSE
jgi:hypothetical protein